MFDSGGNTIALSGILSGPGGLIASGSGVLELSGANTYTGNTTINAGSTLRFDSTSNNSGTFRAANGATLNLNYIGTMTVTSFYTNNVALAAGTYNSGNLPAYITGTGSLQVIGAASVPPLTFSVSGGHLNLSWGATGYTLQQQTNPLTTGLGNNWVDVPGSASVTATNILINLATPAAFYRLRQ
jgi:autotransporter-associated beta strand protein